MTFLTDLKAALPAAYKTIPAGVQLEHSVSLRDHSDHFRLAILTDRKITLDGGNGHDGVDGGAIMCLREAARALLDHDGSLARVAEIVVRRRDSALLFEDI